MVMIWLEGGQGEVRGACAPPPPPNRPTWNPPPPPQGASGQQIVGGVVGVQNRGVPPPTLSPRLVW